ncbi:MAG: hypothetical protein AB1515_01600 [Nitrospirota bacterium]
MSRSRQPDDQAPPPDAPPAPEPAEAVEKVPLFVAVQRMTVAERMQFARRTDKEGRGLLIRDSNKQVALAALANPKLTIQEVEQFAKSRQLDGDLLREIASNLGWMKHYTVVHALAANPKTPVPLAVKMLPRLKNLDLKLLGADRNLPSAIRVTAARLLKARNERG